MRSTRRQWLYRSVECGPDACARLGYTISMANASRHGTPVPLNMNIHGADAESSTFVPEKQHSDVQRTKRAQTLAFAISVFHAISSFLISSHPVLLSIFHFVCRLLEHDTANDGPMMQRLENRLELDNATQNVVDFSNAGGIVTAHANAKILIESPLNLMTSTLSLSLATSFSILLNREEDSNEKSLFRRALKFLNAPSKFSWPFVPHG